MRLAAFHVKGDPTLRFGQVADQELIEVESLWNPQVSLSQRYAIQSVELCPPLPGMPSKIIAVGLNYPAHIQEMKHQEVPENPVLFLKAPSTVIATDQWIVADPAWGRVDYEGELAVVIGQSCKNVPEDKALEMVLGYTLGNDVSARIFQKQDNQWGRAKNFDTFCPLGPYLLKNAGQNPANFHLTSQLEGKMVQEADVSQMRFSVPFLIAYISRIMTLNPGDVILTGTPQGVGPMTDGQEICITIPEIGTLKNRFKCQG